jgi:DNA-binding NtrC family response regulator
VGRAEKLPVRRESLVVNEVPRADPDPGVSLQLVERQLIMDALRRFNWNRAKAARYLGISRKTLLYRIAKHGIEREGPIALSARAFPYGG